MKFSKEVMPSCVESDKQYKRIAAEYRHSSRIIKKRIDKLHNELIHLAYKYPLREGLKERLTMHNQMYRTTSEIGRESEHYYEKGWCRGEIYTLNSR